MNWSTVICEDRVVARGVAAPRVRARCARRRRRCRRTPAGRSGCSGRSATMIELSRRARRRGSRSSRPWRHAVAQVGRERRVVADDRAGRVRAVIRRAGSIAERECPSSGDRALVRDDLAVRRVVAERRDRRPRRRGTGCATVPNAAVRRVHDLARARASHVPHAADVAAGSSARTHCESTLCSCSGCHGSTHATSFSRRSRRRGSCRRRAVRSCCGPSRWPREPRRRAPASHP